MKKVIFLLLMINTFLFSSDYYEEMKAKYYDDTISIQQSAKELFKNKKFKKSFSLFKSQVDYASSFKDNILIVDGLNGMSKSSFQLKDYYEALFWANRALSYLPNDKNTKKNIKIIQSKITTVLKEPIKHGTYGRWQGSSFVSNLTLEIQNNGTITFELHGLRAGSSPLEVRGPAAYGSTSGKFIKTKEGYVAKFDDYLDEFCNLKLLFKQNYLIAKLEGHCAYGGNGLYAEGEYSLLKILN